MMMAFDLRKRGKGWMILSDTFELNRAEGKKMTSSLRDGHPVEKRDSMKNTR
jgi:hypothetical protein